MLNKEDLLNIPVDFNLYQKEKDYLQHIVLSRIYSRTSTDLVFKGGTALQKCFGLNRFSVDLDFTASEKFNEKRLERAFDEVDRFYPTTFTKNENKISLSYKLKMEGPLYHTPLSLQTIRVEISLRESVELPPVNRSITPLYSDLQPYNVFFMDPVEILSEKIMAIITQSKARDLYDLHFLILKNVEPDLTLISRKLEFYSVEFDRDVLMERAMKLEDQWKRELPGLVRNVPDFGQVISRLDGTFRE